MSGGAALRQGDCTQIHAFPGRVVSKPYHQDARRDADCTQNHAFSGRVVSKLYQQDARRDGDCTQIHAFSGRVVSKPYQQDARRHDICTQMACWQLCFVYKQRKKIHVVYTNQPDNQPFVYTGVQTLIWGPGFYFRRSGHIDQIRLRRWISCDKIQST